MRLFLFNLTLLLIVLLLTQGCKSKSKGGGIRACNANLELDFSRPSGMNAEYLSVSCLDDEMTSINYRAFVIDPEPDYKSISH